MTKTDFIEICAVLFGTILTAFLNRFYDLNVVLASSAVGLTGVLLSKFIIKDKKIELPIYLGSFIGMSSTAVLSSYALLLISGIFSGLIFILGKNHLKGIGGKLGTIAFIGVFVTYFLT